ncbi:MAG: hypothetical protein WC364_07605 [Eubacteriales bacterium]
MHFYEKVPSWYVDIKKRATANRILTFCKHDLMLQDRKISLHWFRELGAYSGKSIHSGSAFEAKMRAWGKFDGKHNEVWVNMDQPLDEIKKTVAHEMRHIFQYAGRWTISEADAERYASGY